MRVSFFAWEVVWENFLPLDELKGKGWYLPNRCYLCKGEDELANHILLHCPKVTLLWHLILALFNVQWVMPISVKDVLLSWQGSFVGKKRKKAWRATPLCLFWTLWKERNWRAYEDLELIGHAILCSFIYMFLQWVRIHLGSSTLSLFDFIDWLGC